MTAKEFILIPENADKKIFEIMELYAKYRHPILKSQIKKLENSLELTCSIVSNLERKIKELKAESKGNEIIAIARGEAIINLNTECDLLRRRTKELENLAFVGVRGKVIKNQEYQIKNLEKLVKSIEQQNSFDYKQHEQQIKALEDKLAWCKVDSNRLIIKYNARSEQIKKLEEPEKVLGKYCEAECQRVQFNNQIKKLEDLEQLVELIIDENWADGSDICKALKDQQEGKNKGI